ncbi:hypothetical protein DACRYDRAFT_24507 [Dacryopinax primogenitus]|uniref:Uncharacterized protein n=1 Tax=Dacryopinax primogenitus (strain DJM 731) TaxID=1858805 RepID=M5G3W7_DACPD|nr:uncharacterized protein DACRYDRAFT_24507 [Dacryopinax primogenitus]EJT98457.1 hypothetical protein DACRYDRAFT_24507 [Dacryopinax primogenitus]
MVRGAWSLKNLVMAWAARPAVGDGGSGTLSRSVAWFGRHREIGKGKMKGVSQEGVGRSHDINIPPIPHPLPPLLVLIPPLKGILHPLSSPALKLGLRLGLPLV